jgi:hypothetical protein
MATKKYLKKGKKYHKKRHGMRGGDKIKINYDQVRGIVKRTFELAIESGSTVTKIMLINAVCEILHITITNENMNILFDSGIDVIIASMQFIFYSLRLTADVTASTASSASHVASNFASTLWSSVSSLLSLCNRNPIPTTVIGTAISTTFALKHREISDYFRDLQDYGAIDAITMMLFTLLIRAGIAEDNTGVNQLKLGYNNVQELADNISEASSENTPAPSQTSSQSSSQGSNEISLEDAIKQLEDDKKQFALQLENTISAVKLISDNYENYPALAPKFYEDAVALNLCSKNKRKNDPPEKLDDEEEDEEELGPLYDLIYQPPTNAKRTTLRPYTPPPIVDDSSDEEDKRGGKKTKHRKRKNNKSKTKKIKHTKKHIKKHKKHTKKH